MHKKFFLILFSVLLLVSNVAQANQYSFQGEGSFLVGDDLNDNLFIAKSRAKDRALKNARMKAGVFVSSITSVQDLMVTSDDIEIILSNVVKIEGEPQFQIEGFEDGLAIQVKCNLTAVLDDSNIATQIANREWLKNLARIQSEIEKNNKEIDELQRQYIDSTDEAERVVIRDKIIGNNNRFLANQHLQEGSKYLSTEDFDSALEEYKHALNLNPGSIAAYVDVGIAYYRKGDYYQAVGYYNKALLLDSHDFYALLNRASAYMELEQYDLALRDLKEINPKTAKIYFMLGVADNEINKLHNTYWYSNAIKLDPNYAEAYINRGVEYIESARQDIRLAKKLNVKSRFKSARKSFDFALKDFNKAIQLQPKNAYVYLNRGTVYHEKKKFEQALADYTYAIELEPDNSIAYSNRGATYVVMKKYLLAISDCNRAIELDTNCFGAYVNRGEAYEAIGEIELAISDFKNAILLNPSDEESRKHLAKLQE